MIYNRHVISSLLRLFLITLVVIVLLLWLTKSLKFLELITTNGIGIFSFMKIVALLLTPICFILMPVAVAIALIMTIYNFLQNKEMVVLRASGLSNFQIMKPSLIFAVFVMLLEYCFSFYLLPASYKEFKGLQQEYKNQIIGMFIEEGIFNSQLNDITVYVEKKISEHHFKGIFIYNNQNEHKPSTIIADSGYLVIKETPEFVLYNGVHQEHNNKNQTLSMVKFDSYNVRLETISESADLRVADSNEYNIIELMKFRNFADRGDRMHFINANHRIVWPFFCFSLVVFCGGMMLRGNLGRRVSNKNVLLASIGVVIFLMIDLLLNNYCSKNIYFLPLMYVNAISSLVIGLSLLSQPVRAKHHA